jgi:hypothetical protein
MTRRSTVAFVTLLAGLASLTSVGVASACGPVFTAQNVSATAGVMHRVCASPDEVFMLCHQQQPDGTWTTEELQADNTWLVVGTQIASPALGDLNAISR